MYIYQTKPDKNTWLHITSYIYADFKVYMYITIASRLWLPQCTIQSSKLKHMQIFTLYHSRYTSFWGLVLTRVYNKEGGRVSYSL